MPIYYTDINKIDVPDEYPRVVGSYHGGYREYDIFSVRPIFGFIWRNHEKGSGHQELFGARNRDTQNFDDPIDFVYESYKEITDAIYQSFIEPPNVFNPPISRKKVVKKPSSKVAKKRTSKKKTSGMTARKKVAKKKKTFSKKSVLAANKRSISDFNSFMDKFENKEMEGVNAA